jgi:hypothetical protein
MNHPVCSPNLVPDDFHPFVPLQKRLGGKRLAAGLYVDSIICTGSRDRVLVIVTILLGERPTNLSLIHDKGQASFNFQRPPDLDWGPPSLVLNEFLSSFPGVKRPGREADHSSPFSAELKNV